MTSKRNQKPKKHEVYDRAKRATIDREITDHALDFMKRKAKNNPWGEGGDTLEWTISSPPAFHTFEEIPKVK